MIALRIFALGVVLAFMKGLVLANGGPFEFGVASTGNGSPTETTARTNVTIDEELLTIDLHQEFALVEVRYKMRNTGDAVEQPFYFPVERWEDDLQDYRIEIDGQPIPVTASGRDKPTPSREDEMAPDKPARRWKRSVIPFANKQSRNVVIRYRSRHSASGMSVSEDVHSSPTVFAYALSPAAAWKEPIKRGAVIIQVSTAIPENVVIERPRDRFRPDGPGRFKWEFANLRPTKTDDIRVVVEPGYTSYERPGYTEDQNAERRPKNVLEYRLEPKRYFLDHDDFDISASSTLASDEPDKYSIQNVRLKNWGEQSTRTWSEGAEGDGIGESILIKSRRPLPLAAILIMPGFKNSKMPERWETNNRVAGLRITLNNEFTFDASIPDEKFSGLYPIPIRGYNKPVETVKMVITAVHRGTLHRDTCISQIMLRAKLDKKPAIQGAR